MQRFFLNTFFLSDIDSYFERNSAPDGSILHDTKISRGIYPSFAVTTGTEHLFAYAIFLLIKATTLLVRDLCTQYSLLKRLGTWGRIERARPGMSHHEGLRK